MTIVAAVLAASLIICVVCFAQLLRAQQRAHARREDLILNQLLHATGHTWQPPPAEERPAPEQDVERWTFSPEQYPAD